MFFLWTSMYVSIFQRSFSLLPFYWSSKPNLRYPLRLIYCLGNYLYSQYNSPFMWKAASGVDSCSLFYIISKSLFLSLYPCSVSILLGELQISFSSHLYFYGRYCAAVATDADFFFCCRPQYQERAHANTHTHTAKFTRKILKFPVLKTQTDKKAIYIFIAASFLSPVSVSSIPSTYFCFLALWIFTVAA